MKRYTFSFLGFVTRAVLVCVVINIGADLAAAQATRNINSSARRLEEFNKQSENVSRDQMSGEIRPRKPTAEEVRQVKATNAQIAEDLEALQVGYNEIVVKLQSKEAVTNVFISENATSIHKHASRLKGLIKFPELKDAKLADPAALAEQATSVRKQLVTLCNRILAFFESPMLVSPNVLDVQKADAARQILDLIIQTSSTLKDLK